MWGSFPPKRALVKVIPELVVPIVNEGEARYRARLRYRANLLSGIGLL
jgi:hypothetical protein